jgi:hypothetical protein
MKTKLCWFCLSIIAAGIIATAGEYIVRLSDRTQLLEARLARVEGDLNSTRVARAQVITTQSRSTQPGGAPMFQFGLTLPGTATHESLESRVTKIEQELKPHLELLTFPTSGVPGR